MAKPIFPAPTAGFEVPLEMLSACHRRIQDQCSILCGLVPYLVAHGADAQARAAAAGAVRYFATAATHHHADEDEDLFPAWRDSMAKKSRQPAPARVRDGKSSSTEFSDS